MLPKLLNFGSVNVDYVYQVPRTVRPGETLGSVALTQGPGGKGFNQSVAFARAGGKVQHAGRLGHGAGWLRDLLASEGLDVRLLTDIDQPTGHAIIQITPDGQNAILLHPGANASFTPDDITPLLTEFGLGDWLLCQNETSCVPEMICAAHERGMVVCFNPAPMSAAVADYPLDRVDWLIINETEGEGLTGESVASNILATLATRFPTMNVVLTLGDKGVIAATTGRRIEVPAQPVKAVDTTAAGDTFIGYLLAGIVGGMELESALQRANKAAAISVTRPGAATSVPYEAEVVSHNG